MSCNSWIPGKKECGNSALHWVSYWKTGPPKPGHPVKAGTPVPPPHLLYVVPSENVKPLPKKININQRPTSIVEDTKTAIVSRMGPVKDPMTGEMITRSEFRKKYGVSPK